MKVVKYFCDVCKKEINPPGVANNGWGGHIGFRLQTPQGLKGGKLLLCGEHAEQVHQFIQEIQDEVRD